MDRTAFSRASIATALIFLALAGTACVSSPEPRTRVVVGIRGEPPEPRVIVVPSTRAGYVYAPGYWQWRGNRYTWVEGRYVRERRGQVWVADHYDRRGNDYIFVRGHWERRLTER
jgi:hypothetical protein